MVIFVMAFFLLFITGGLVFSQLELKKAGNLKLAIQAVEVADAGLQHALASIPWVWNFNAQLGCGTPPCALASNSAFPAGSDFSYSATAQNDPADTGGAASDTNNIIVLASRSSGPSGSTSVVQAYVGRSAAPFRPPSTLYINAASAAPQADSSNSSADGFFDLDDNIVITGNDTNTDNTAGPAGALRGIAATSSAVTSALTGEYTSTYPGGSTGIQLHEVVGLGGEPSIDTVSDVLDVDALATNFYDQATTVKYFNGLTTDSTTCPSSNPCQFGTSAVPQITYIKETYDSDLTLLRGHITGYGVLVLEGRPTIGENFKFYGLVVHKRPNGSAYISFEDSASVHGGVLLGSYDEGDGKGKKTRLGVKDLARLYYSSQALATVDTNWGNLLPKPPRIFAWLGK